MPVIAVVSGVGAREFSEPQRYTRINFDLLVPVLVLVLCLLRLPLLTDDQKKPSSNRSFIILESPNSPGAYPQPPLALPRCGANS